MEITLHDAMTVIHGIVFGAFLLLAYSGLAAGLYATTLSRNPWVLSPGEKRAFSLYFATMAALAWAAVIFGAYVIYPWYRAKLPPGVIDLSAYPRQFLTSNPSTTGWHDIGMEWKEHFAWFAPICLTAAAVVFAQYGSRLRGLSGLRSAVIGLCAIAFVATGVAGFFGAMLNKYAPVRGGATIVLMRGETHGR